MLISCEKCSTTYVLDDALIPAEGAPVQCTRCGHVFTAQAPAAARAEAPAPRIPAHTMMFGGGGAPAGPDRSPGPPQPAANRTVIFGATSPEAAAARDAAGGPARQTMMFGQGGSAKAPSAAKPGGQTMMFGNATEAPAAAPTPTDAAGVSRQTMMFGRGGEASSAPAPSPRPSPHKPVGANQTMMFGRTQPGAAAPPPASSAAPAPAPANQTLMFGQGTADGSPPTPSAPPRAAQTMVFGTSAAPKPATELGAQGAKTVIFGPPGGPGGVAPTPSAAPSVEPPATVSPAAVGRSTMIFGAEPVPASAPARPAGTDRTIRFDVQEMMQRQQAAAVAGADPLAGRRHPGTEVKGPAGPEAKGPPSAEVKDGAVRHNRTQLFALSSEGAGGASLQPASLDPDGAGTLPPDVPLRPTEATARTQELESLDPATRAPEGIPLGRSGTSPGEPVVQVASSPQRRTDQLPARELPARGEEAQFDEVLQLTQRQARRRARVAIAVLVVVILGLVAALAYNVVKKRLFSPGPDQAKATVTEALAKLRLDDPDAQQEVVDALSKVAQRFPEFIDARAGLLIAQAFQYDDIRQQINRVQVRHNELVVELKKVGEAGAADSAAKSAALKERIARYSARVSANEPKAKDAHQRVEVARKAMEDAARDLPPDVARERDLLRARGLLRAIFGQVEALQLAAELEKGGPDDFGGLIAAEYHANAATSEADRQKALATLDALRRRPGNDTLIRTYVLAARLKLAGGDLKGAGEELQVVLGLRPKHAVATEMSEWLAQHAK